MRTEMQIRIEKLVTREAIKAFLDDRELRVPVFLDMHGHGVITINPRNRADAIVLIDWLMTR